MASAGNLLVRERRALRAQHHARTAQGQEKANA
jgi:hypothetical protein